MSRKHRHITDDEFKAAVDTVGRDARALVEELGCSKATVYRHLEKVPAVCGDNPSAPTSSDLGDLVPQECSYWISRPINKDVEDLSDTGYSVLLIGPAGGGKTLLAKEIAAILHIPFLRISCHPSFEFEDVIGWHSIQNGSMIFHEGLLVIVMQSPCVILFDEINALDSAKAKAINQLLDSRRMFVEKANKTYEMHTDARMFLAGNPPGGRYGVNPLLADLANRCICREVPAFTPSEIRHFVRTHHSDIEAHISDRLVRLYDDMRRFCSEQDAGTEISIRNIQHFAAIYQRTHNLNLALHASFIDVFAATGGEESKKVASQIVLARFGKFPP